MTAKPATPAAKPNDVPTKELTAAKNAPGQDIARTVPRLKLTKNGFSIDHPDQKVGERLMMEALGTTDRDFMYGILRQLANATRKQTRPR
jgi:hypothetical protein